MIKLQGQVQTASDKQQNGVHAGLLPEKQLLCVGPRLWGEIA